MLFRQSASFLSLLTITCLLPSLIPAIYISDYDWQCYNIQDCPSKQTQLGAIGYTGAIRNTTKQAGMCGNDNKGGCTTLYHCGTDTTDTQLQICGDQDSIPCESLREDLLNFYYQCTTNSSALTMKGGCGWSYLSPTLYFVLRKGGGDAPQDLYDAHQGEL